MQPQLSEYREQETSSSVQAAVSASPTAGWAALTRISFRFAFVYFGLFNLDVVLHLLPFPPFAQLLWVFDRLRGGMVHWVATHLLHVAHDFGTDYLNPVAGSKDTTYNYVQALCYLGIAFVATLIWSAADRKRRDYDLLHRWFLLYVRVALAAGLISYGVTKIFPYQFPPPLLSQLLQSYGNSDRNQLFWMSMQVSPLYAFFGGLMEIVAGLLLMIPRLDVLGALLSMAVMGNLLMLNFGYDIKAKLLVIHLLLMAAIILLPQVARLADFFLWNRETASAPDKPLFRRAFLNRAVIALQIIFAVALAGNDVYRTYQLSSQAAASRRTPLAGIWFVDDFQLNGQSRPPLSTNAHRWQRMIVNAQDDVVVQVMTGETQPLYLRSDARAKTFVLTENGMPGWIAELTYDNPNPGLLLLTGKMGGKPVVVRLHREDDSRFLLNDHSVHWINDAVK